MNKNHKETGKCDFTIAKTPFSIAKIALPLRKNSPYTDSITKG